MKKKVIILPIMAMLALSTFIIGSNINNKPTRLLADTSYKTFYLIVPDTQVTRSAGADPMYWDEVDENVRFLGSTPETSSPGVTMQKIDTHLYAYTYAYNSTDDVVDFTSMRNSTLVLALQDGSAPRIRDISSYNSYSILTYNRSSYSDPTAGTWGNYSISTASQFFKTFNAVIGDGTCEASGNTVFAKLSSTWSEMKELYDTLTGEELLAVKNASKDSGNTDESNFAKLYDYINNKYYGDLNNFAERVRIAPNLSRDTTSTTLNNQTYTALIATIIVSLSLLSLVIYFYFRKKTK